MLAHIFITDQLTHECVPVQGDGQPLLHKAALCGSYEMLELLAETLVYQRKQRLDSIRDQVLCLLQ